MRKDLFQVLDQADRSMGYFKATTASQAKMAVNAGLTVKKLSGEEIYNVYQNGYGVSNVVDGRVFLGELEPEVDPNQQDLPIGNALDGQE